MITRHRRIVLALILLTAFLAASYFAYTVSAENPSAGKTKKAVEAADAATKKAQGALDAAFGATMAANSGTKYPDNEDGRDAAAADSYADSKDAAADAALKAAAAARAKACKSGKAEDAKAADEAEKAVREREAEADAAAAEADKADAKADPYGKQLQKKKRAVARALRAAFKAAMAAICFARQCAQLMDESSEQNKRKKEATIKTIDGFGSSTDQLLAFGQPARGDVQTAEGLHRISFDTLQGRVIVNLPDDMRAGDTISGTVITQPKGDSPQEVAENQAKMNRSFLKLGTVQTRSGPSDLDVAVPLSAAITPFTFKLPKVTSVGNTPPTTIFPWIVAGDPGRVDVVWYGSDAGVPINSGTWGDYLSKDFSCPTIGQQGRPIEIIGPFDGHVTNTWLMYGPTRSSIQDFEKNTESVSGGFGLIRPLAESPRKCVFEVPTTIAGPVRLYVKDGDLATVAPTQVVGINLSGKTNLLKGERTTLTIQVSGLQGITKSVPLTLESHGVIRMEGGTFQPLVIQPSQVGADGRYTTTRGITGIQTGAWQATATVVTLPPLIRLIDSSPPRQLLINTRTGHYDFCGAGEKFSGNAQVKADGCTFYFFEPDNLETTIGVLNACTFNDRYWVFAGGPPSLTVDLRVKVDNVNPPKTRVYFNPRGKPFAPIQDVSAFATCP